MAKGSQFERDVCRQLSRWWGGPGTQDVLFWRTSQSGGRATTRNKSGRKTAASHCGDIAALDERGAPLTRLITWELKTGYSSATLHALVDHPADKPHPKKQSYFTWIAQAIAASRLAGTPYWAIVHHRPKRSSLLTIPAELWDALGCTDRTVTPPVVRLTYPNLWAGMPPYGTPAQFVSVTLEGFLDGVTPSEIRRLNGAAATWSPVRNESSSSAPCATSRGT